MPSSEMVPHPNAEVVAASEVPMLMDLVRPSWQAKGLIARVRRLLPVDPSSACQRIFNAAVHDLREKVVLAGVDIAKEVARDHRLPPIERSEDVENYSTAKLLDLAYWMGLLSRPEWRRLSRVYEIRRDLEHEDDEYEAGIEDCIYVFKTCIEAVLSKDPITLIRVIEVKQIVEAPNPVVPDVRLIEDFEHAPNPRQEEIFRFLLSVALDDNQPDLVRQNSYSALKLLSAYARDAVKVALAQHLQERLGRTPLTQLQARVASAAGLLPYLRRAQRTQFFESFLARMEQIGYEWGSHASHGELLRTLQEVGGLSAIPDAVRRKVLRWLVLAYVGEPGGYGTWGRNRRVFYSNSAAPLVEEILYDVRATVGEELQGLRSDPEVQDAISNEHVARRFERLVDLVEA